MSLIAERKSFKVVLQHILTLVLCVYVNNLSAQEDVPHVDAELFPPEEFVTEDDESLTRHEKDKYQLEMAIEEFRETIDATRDPTEEEIKAILDTKETVEESPVENTDSDESVEEVADDYEFPQLVIVDPGQVGDEVGLELQDGKFFRRITRSVRPPVFGLLLFCLFPFVSGGDT